MGVNWCDFQLVFFAVDVKLARCGLEKISAWQFGFTRAVIRFRRSLLLFG